MSWRHHDSFAMHRIGPSYVNIALKNGSLQVKLGCEIYVVGVIQYVRSRRVSNHDKISDLAEKSSQTEFERHPLHLKMSTMLENISFKIIVPVGAVYLSRWSRKFDDELTQNITHRVVTIKHSFDQS